MAFLFLAYLIGFYFVYKRQKSRALILFVLATVFSIVMFLYHTTSELNLNF